MVFPAGASCAELNRTTSVTSVSATTAAMIRRMFPPSFNFTLLHQVALEYDKIIRVAGIPANSHDVIPQRDREMNELALMVQALAADVLIPMILRPGVLRLGELSSHTMAANVGQNPSQPVI